MGAWYCMSLNPKIDPTHLKDEENQRLLTPEQIEQVKDYFDKNPNAVKLSRRDPAAKAIFGENAVLEGFTVTKLEDPHNPGSFKLCAIYIGKARKAEDPSRLLGEGGFGRVKLGQLIDTGEWVALKVQKKIVKGEDRSQAIKEEDSKLIALGEAKGTLERTNKKDETKFYTAMVLGPATDYKAAVDALEKQYADDPKLLREKKLQIGIILVNTVDAWHKTYKWVHRDLKSPNILMDPNQKINATPDHKVLKIIDFGSSGKLDSNSGKYTHADPSQRLEGMTTGYIATELINTGINGQDPSAPAFSPETDAYAIGRMLCETFHPAGIKLASHILTPEEQKNTREFMAKYYTESTLSEIPEAFFKDRLVYVELIDVLSDMPERLKPMIPSDISLREVLFNSVHPDPSQRLTFEEMSAELEQISRFDALFEQISKENQTKEIRDILGKTGERQIEIAKKLMEVLPPAKINDLQKAVVDHDERQLKMQKRKLGEYIQNLELYITGFGGCDLHRERLVKSLPRLKALLDSLNSNIPLNEQENEEFRNIRIVCNKINIIQDSHKLFLNSKDLANRLISQYGNQKSSEVTVDPLKSALNEYENSIVTPDWNESIKSILHNIEEKRKAFVRQKEILEKSSSALETIQSNHDYLKFVAPQILTALNNFNTQPALESIKNHSGSLVREINESRATLEAIKKAIINEGSSLESEKVWVEFQHEIETLIQNVKQADTLSKDNITEAITQIRNEIGMVYVLESLANDKSNAGLVSQFDELKKHLIELERAYRLLGSAKDNESKITSRDYNQVMRKFEAIKEANVSPQEYAYSLAKIREEFNNESRSMISAIQDATELQPQALKDVKHSEDALKDIVPLFDGDRKILKGYMEMSNFLSNKKEETDFRKEHLNPDVAAQIANQFENLKVSFEKVEKLKTGYPQSPMQSLAELEKEMKVFRDTQQFLEKRYKNIVFSKKPTFDDLVKILSSSIDEGKSKIVVPEIPSIKFEYRTNGDPRFPRRLSSRVSPEKSYGYMLYLIKKSINLELNEEQQKQAREIVSQIKANIGDNRKLSQVLKKIETMERQYAFLTTPGANIQLDSVKISKKKSKIKESKQLEKKIPLAIGLKIENLNPIGSSVPETSKMIIDELKISIPNSPNVQNYEAWKQQKTALVKEVKDFLSDLQDIAPSRNSVVSQALRKELDSAYIQYRDERFKGEPDINKRNELMKHLNEQEKENLLNITGETIISNMGLNEIYFENLIAQSGREFLEDFTPICLFFVLKEFYRRTEEEIKKGNIDPDDSEKMIAEMKKLTPEGTVKKYQKLMGINAQEYFREEIETVSNAVLDIIHKDPPGEQPREDLNNGILRKSSSSVLFAALQGVPGPHPDVQQIDKEEIKVVEAAKVAEGGKVEEEANVEVEKRADAGKPFDINEATSFAYLRAFVDEIKDIPGNVGEHREYQPLVDFLNKLKVELPVQYKAGKDYNELYTELHRLAASLPVVDARRKFRNDQNHLEAFHNAFFVNLYENKATLNVIIHEGLELNVGKEGKSQAELIRSQLEAKGAAVEPHHFTHPGHAFNEIKGAIGFGFNPLGETNRPYIIFEGEPKILRFGTQITGYATLQPAFINYLAVKKAQKAVQNEKAAQNESESIHHVYFNLMKRPIAVKELDIPRRIIESLKTKALEKLNRRGLGVAVVTLPAAGRYFTRGYLTHEGRAKRPNKRYDCDQLREKTIKSILSGKNDFMIPESLGAIKEREILESEFNASVDSILGKDSGRTMITAEERQAILFDFIKYRLPKLIIKELNPDTVNFSCKDAIDRGGVNTLWYEFRRRLDEVPPKPMTLDEFNMNLDAAALLVKSRPANENRNLLWNALNLYYEKNPDKFTGDMSWVKKWIEDNHPNKEALKITTYEAIKEALDSYKSAKYKSKAKEEAINSLSLGSGGIDKAFVQNLFSQRVKVMKAEGEKSDLSGRFYEKTDEVITHLIREYKKNVDEIRVMLDDCLIKDVLALLSQIAKQCPAEKNTINGVLNRGKYPGFDFKNADDFKDLRTFLVRIKNDVKSSNPDLVKVLDRKIGQIEELQVVLKVQENAVGKPADKPKAGDRPADIPTPALGSKRGPHS